MEEKGEHSDVVEGSGHVTWYLEMSPLMRSHLAGLVANGTKTSSGFKKVHLNACARAVNEHCKTNITSDNVKNHLRTWPRRFVRINKLRAVSAFGWVEDKFMITLDHEHYASYVKDHKQDAEYLNKPLEHYGEMVAIFGNSMATGKYAKGSSEALGTEEGETEIEEGDVNAADGSAIPATQDDNGATSSAPKPKRAKTTEGEEDGLIAAFKEVGEKLSKAIVEAGGTSLHAGLFENLNSFPVFHATHISVYYAHLVANPLIARAFHELPFQHKLNWVTMFIHKKFPVN